MLACDDIMSTGWTPAAASSTLEELIETVHVERYNFKFHNISITNVNVKITRRIIRTTVRGKSGNYHDCLITISVTIKNVWGNVTVSTWRRDNILGGRLHVGTQTNSPTGGSSVDSCCSALNCGGRVSALSTFRLLSLLSPDWFFKKQLDAGMWRYHVNRMDARRSQFDLGRVDTYI